MRTLYSTDEVAKLFQINRSTVKRWTDEKKLDCTKTPGGHRRFSREAIIAFSKRFRFSDKHVQESLLQSDDAFVVDRLVSDIDSSSIQSDLMFAAMNGKRFDVRTILMNNLPASFSFEIVIQRLIVPLLRKLDQLHRQGRIERELLLLSKTTMIQPLLWDKKPMYTGELQGMNIILITAYEELTPELWLLDAWYSSQGYTVINSGIPLSADHLTAWSPLSPKGSVVLCLVQPEQNVPAAHRMLLDLTQCESHPAFQWYSGTLSALLYAVSTAIQFSSNLTADKEHA
jgi:excisionase family DNA binding protein